MTHSLSIAAPEDRVRAIAYTLWLEEGRPDGRAEAHWLQACEIAAKETAPKLRSAASAARKPAAPRAKRKVS